MVKQQKKHSKKKRSSKGFKANATKARKINASTIYETCNEQLSPFGGLLAVIKFLDLLKFKEIFNSTYQSPSRDPKMGHYLMVVGILMLLFIGFNRIWHFTYVRLDAMICGFFRLTRLPVASTFWRYVDSLGLNQARSFLKIINQRKAEIGNYKAYQSLLKNTHVPELYLLVKALAISRKSETYNDLLTFLDNPHPNIVCMAFYALGRRGDKSAVKKILKKIEVSDHWYCQWYAYKALRTLEWKQRKLK